MKGEVVVSTRIERWLRDALVERACELGYENLSQFLRSALRNLAIESGERMHRVSECRHEEDTTSKSSDPLDDLVSQLSKES